MFKPYPGSINYQLSFERPPDLEQCVDDDQKEELVVNDLPEEEHGRCADVWKLREVVEFEEFQSQFFIKRERDRVTRPQYHSSSKWNKKCEYFDKKVIQEINFRKHQYRPVKRYFDPDAMKGVKKLQIRKLKFM